MKYTKLLLSILFISILIGSVIPADASLIYHDFPPTPAFRYIGTPTGQISAKNYHYPLNITSSGCVTVSGVNSTHTLSISGSGCTSATKQGTYNTTQANNANINTGGYKINFINGTNGQVNVINSPSKNQVNVTIGATTPTGITSINSQAGPAITVQGGGSTTVTTTTNTITVTGKTYQNNTGQNLGTHGTGIYSGMSGSVLQFLSLIVKSGLSISSNSTNVILSLAIKVNNATCTNDGKHFFNSFDNVTGNLICGAVSGFLTNAVLSINGDTTATQNIKGRNSITVNDDNAGNHYILCKSCINGTVKQNYIPYANQTYSINQTKFQWDNTNSIMKPSADLSANIGDNTTRVNHVNARNVTSTYDYQNGTRNIDTVSGVSPITATKSGDRVYVACPTCGTSTGTVNTIQNIGKGGQGVLAAIVGGSLQGKNVTGIKNINVYSNSTDVKLSANNTAYAQNILSNSGTSGGSGYGPYLNQTNATLINLKSILSRNSFTLVTANKTNIIVNSSVPASNVIDIYDTTIGDYSTPSGATASSISSPTNNTVIFANTNTALSWAVGTMQVGKITGLTSNTEYNEVVFKVKTAAGNIRAKVYQDNGAGGLPSTLLAESNSVPVVGSTAASLYVPLITSFKVPASGKIWVGFEVDSASSVFLGNSSGVVMQQQTHTFGAGPSPFGSPSGTENTAGQQMRIVNNQTAANTIDGNTGSYWTSNVEANPNIYIDTGSAQVLSGVAIYWNGTSTATQLLLQTSTDHVTWNTKRTVETSLLTDKAWNFIRWDLDSALQRYVRIYGNDGTNKQLSIYELKALIPSTTTLIMRHGHEFIDSTNATLPLNR